MVREDRESRRCRRSSLRNSWNFFSAETNKKWISSRTFFGESDSTKTRNRSRTSFEKRCDDVDDDDVDDRNKLDLRQKVWKKTSSHCSQHINPVRASTCSSSYFKTLTDSWCSPLTRWSSNEPWGWLHHLQIPAEVPEHPGPVPERHSSSFRRFEKRKRDWKQDSWKNLLCHVSVENISI